MHGEVPGLITILARHCHVARESWNEPNGNRRRPRGHQVLHQPREVRYTKIHARSSGHSRGLSAGVAPGPDHGSDTSRLRSAGAPPTLRQDIEVTAIDR